LRYRFLHKLHLHLIHLLPLLSLNEVQKGIIEDPAVENIIAREIRKAAALIAPHIHHQVPEVAVERTPVIRERKTGPLKMLQLKTQKVTDLSLRQQQKIQLLGRTLRTP
jgi:hypothetical protein